jgi:ribosomal-protein-serine acetyltransferase
MHDMPFPTLKIDPTFELRFLHLGDAEKLFLALEQNRSYLRQWLPWLDMNTRIEDSRNFINTVKMNFIAKGSHTFGIFFEHKLVGIIGIHDLDQDNQKTSIGYWLSEAYQGKGIMTRAVSAVLDYAFHDLKMNRMEIRCATGNQSSRAIPERLGFKHEGTLRQAEWLYHRFVDHEVYSMLRTEWERRGKD